MAATPWWNRLGAGADGPALPLPAVLGADAPFATRRRGVLIAHAGAGLDGHLPALQRPEVAARLRLVAVLDAESRVPRPAAPRRCTHFADLDYLGRLDFVIVGTPPAARERVILAALARGWHVLSDAPAALAPDAAGRIAEAARRAGRVVMTCLPHQHNPVWQRIRRWLAAGTIGPWYRADFEVRCPGPADAASLLTDGMGALGQLLDIAGLPDDVHPAATQGGEVLRLRCGERTAFIRLTPDAGASATAVRIAGPRGSIEWADGMLVLEELGRVERRDCSGQLDPRCRAEWFAGAHQAFAEAIARRDQAGPLAELERLSALIAAVAPAADAPRERAVSA